MAVLRHKLGLVLDLSEPVDPEHRKIIEQGIAGITGVVSADFSRAQGNMVVVEYDPYLTTPAELHQTIATINRGAVLRTVFVSRPPASEDAETA